MVRVDEAKTHACCVFFYRVGTMEFILSPATNARHFDAAVEPPAVSPGWVMNCHP
jgi:hypothetical protein